MAKGLGYYEKMLEELPVETTEGLRVGAIGRITVKTLIDDDTWFNMSNQPANSPTVTNSGENSDGDYFEETVEYSGWLVNTAKAIQGQLKDYPLGVQGCPECTGITSTFKLTEYFEKYLKSDPQNPFSLDDLINLTGIIPASLDVKADKTDIQSRSIALKKKLMERTDTGDLWEAATWAATDILAYNLLNNDIFHDIQSISAGEYDWYDLSLSGDIYNAIREHRASLEAREDKAALNEELMAQRQEELLAGKSEKELDAKSKEQQITDIKFHLQMILAANMVALANLSMNRRSYDVGKYKKTYMMQAHPSEIINKLTYVPGSEQFTEITVAEASSLIPRIQLYKILYNSKGEHEQDLPIVFSSYTKTEDLESSGLDGLGRSGVGIKSFDWQYNGTNVATVKNDITAKLVLYFQNFNDLLKVQSGGFRYVDLLIRTKPGDTEGSDKPIEDADVPDTSQPKTNIADPRHFEIKAAVGWAPNLDYANRMGNTGLGVGISGQTTSLFLTLIEHEFSIQQDGTFELTIDYRGRIDGLMMDKRADIILTEETRNELCLLEKKLEAAQSDCIAEDINQIKHDIKLAKQEARSQSGVDIILGRLKGNKVYCVEVEKTVLEAAGGQIINIPSDQLNGLTDLKLLSSVELDRDSNVSALEEQEQAIQQKLDESDGTKNPGGCDDTWGEALASVVSSELGEGWSLDDFGADDLGDLSSPSAIIASIIGRTAAETGITDWVLENTFGLETDATDDAHIYDCFVRAYHDQRGTTNTGDVITDTKLVENPSGVLGSTFGLTEDDGRVIIPYFFFGDLVDLAADKALGESKFTASEDECGGSFHPNRVQNLGIILGTMHLNKVGTDNAATLNIGDIPIALPYFRDWWSRHVSKAKADTFPLVRFIRECLKDFVIEAVGGEVLEGRRPQRLLMKDVSISIPALENGMSPIEDKIKTAPFKPTTNQPFNEQRLIASRLPGDSITIVHPLSPINPEYLTPSDMFHYKVFYLVNEASWDPAPEF